MASVKFHRLRQSTRVCLWITLLFDDPHSSYIIAAQTFASVCQCDPITHIGQKLALGEIFISFHWVGSDFIALGGFFLMFIYYRKNILFFERFSSSLGALWRSFFNDILAIFLSTFLVALLLQKF